MATGTASPLTFTATAGGGSSELCPADNHAGIMIAIVDLGTHRDISKDGRPTDIRKLAMFWELPAVLRSDGQPFIVGKELAISFDGKPNFGERSGFRLLIEGWRGKKFETGEEINVAVMVGQPCMVNVIHDTTAKGKTVAQVEGVKKFPAGLPKPTPRHSPVFYTTDMGEPPDLEWLPYLFGRKVTDTIHASQEFGGPAGGARLPAPATSNGNTKPSDDDDIPF